MDGTLIVFFILAFIAFGSSVFLLNAKKMSHMTGALVLILLSMAGLYVLLSAGVTAVVQVLVYAGGVGLVVWLSANRMKHSHLLGITGGRIRISLTAIGLLAFLIVLFQDISDLSLAGGSILYEQFAERIPADFYFIPMILMVFLLFAAFIGAMIFAKRDHEKGLSHDE